MRSTGHLAPAPHHACPSRHSAACRLCAGEEINDQVQGGAPSYRNNLLFFKVEAPIWGRQGCLGWRASWSGLAAAAHAATCCYLAARKQQGFPEGAAKPDCTCCAPMPQEFGFEPHEVQFRIAFGTGDSAWTNHR